MFMFRLRLEVVGVRLHFAVVMVRIGMWMGVLLLCITTVGSQRMHYVIFYFLNSPQRYTHIQSTKSDVN